jgi:hypothetical protein
MWLADGGVRGWPPIASSPVVEWGLEMPYIMGSMDCSDPLAPTPHSRLETKEPRVPEIRPIRSQ